MPEGEAPSRASPGDGKSNGRKFSRAPSLSL